MPKFAERGGKATPTVPEQEMVFRLESSRDFFCGDRQYVDSVKAALHRRGIYQWTRPWEREAVARVVAAEQVFMVQVAGVRAGLFCNPVDQPGGGFHRTGRFPDVR